MGNVGDGIDLPIALAELIQERARRERKLRERIKRLERNTEELWEYIAGHQRDVDPHPIARRGSAEVRPEWGMTVDGKSIPNDA